MIKYFFKIENNRLIDRGLGELLDRVCIELGKGEFPEVFF